MTSGLKTIIYPVKDLAQAKTLYGALLGATPSTDEPYYVGFSTAEQTGPVGYWHVDDLRATLQRLLDAGAAPQRPARDVGGGKLIATVTDADGNVMGLMQNP